MPASGAVRHPVAELYDRIDDFVQARVADARSGVLAGSDAARALDAPCSHRLGVDHGPVLRALTVAGTLQSRASATVSGDFVGRACAANLPNWQDVTAHGLRRGGAHEIADAGGDPWHNAQAQP